MWLREYLNDTEYLLIQDKYSEEYLNTIDQNNFIAIYNILKKYNISCLKDVIIKYLEIFLLNPDTVEEKLMLLKIEYLDLNIINTNLNILDFILEQ